MNTKPEAKPVGLPREALPVRIDGGPLTGQTRLRPNEAHELVVFIGGRHVVTFSRQQLSEFAEVARLHTLEMDVDERRGTDRIHDAIKRLGA